jgi:NAD(P)H-dependent flavin oxidoreductase YrpB (nitropropane dioxygenase family)
VVAAVSNAGGFGVLGAVGFSPEQLEIELQWIDDHVKGKPYGVDVVMPIPGIYTITADIESAERKGSATFSHTLK